MVGMNEVRVSADDVSVRVSLRSPELVSAFRSDPGQVIAVLGQIAPVAADQVIVDGFTECLIVEDAPFAAAYYASISDAGVRSDDNTICGHNGIC